MKKQELNKYITDPETLNSSTLNDIRSLLNDYPYFQTAHLLSVKNLFNVSHEDFSKELNLSAAHIPDRKMLYYLLHSAYEVIEVDEGKSETKGTDYEKEKKDTLQENISDALASQLEFLTEYGNEQIELIPEIAIDIRKEYGEGIELEEDFLFRKPL